MARKTYPLQVEINEERILKLKAVYIKAYKNILSLLKSSTDFGSFHRRQILGQIDSILEEMGVDIRDYLEEELPDYYKMGADDAVRQLKHLGAPINVERGFNLIHQEAIIAITDDTMISFGEGINGVSRAARRLMSEASKDLIRYELAEGTISGSALREVRRKIRGILEEEGLEALVDKAGRRWSLDRYSEMLIRTKAVEARNIGMANRMVENQYDLVQVTDHMDECELCRPWEGKILSLTGNTPGYPTLAEAEAAGLFHPNCRHAINALVPILAEKTRAYYPEEKTKKISEAEIKKAVGETRTIDKDP